MHPGLTKAKFMEFKLTECVKYDMAQASWCALNGDRNQPDL